jgi:Secretion system C-terminal sorting domain
MTLKNIFFVLLLSCSTTAHAQMDIQLRNMNNLFEVWLMPKANYTGVVTDAKFTISWNASYNVDLGVAGTETLYVPEISLIVGNVPQETITNGSKKYRNYSLSAGGNKTFTNNVPVKIMTVSYSGQGMGTGQFSIDDDAFTTANNYDYYFELNAIDITGATSSIATSVVLPLELLDFKAVQEDKSVLLNWKTANERNVSHFEVERSTTAQNWITIAKISASDIKNPLSFSKNTEGAYFSKDEDAFTQSNTVLYRLKMVNQDGSFTYSKAITLQRTGDFSRLKLYPNPAHNALQLTIESNKNTTQTIDIVDIIGKAWQQTTVNLSKGQNQQTFDVQALPSGVYFLKMTDNKGINQTLKWVKL